MVAKTVFKRYEIKYKISKEIYEKIIGEIENNLVPDYYGVTTIQSLYFDTDTNLLIRNSIEKPFYKEKIRARSYGLIKSGDKAFLELKKKCEKVVYKRRVTIGENEILPFINGDFTYETQIQKEIRYFCQYYQNLKPSMLILYDRTAFEDKYTDLRVTFDKNIRYRTDRLNLHAGLDGIPILSNGEVMMEVKTSGAFPTWLIKLLNENKIYKTSFSKYGTAYQLEEIKKREKTLQKMEAV